jgi:dTDP-4-amino-4,6-dideoxygalactose transaminase
MNLEKRNIPIALPMTGQEEWDSLKDPIMSGWVTQGPKVACFENLFAEIHGVKHALGVTSCTTGLHLILAAMDIKPGDEVVLPSFTWVATANVVLHCGATPVFVDVDPTTFNINIEQAIAAVTTRTKVVIAVHLFGLCADINSLRSGLPGHVKIVEDAACAAGATTAEGYAGALGDAASFSFHPRKSVTTGEGGMVTTNDDELSEKMRQLSNHGATISEEQRHHGPRPYLLPDFNLLGYNYRMTDLQGAVGCVQIQKLKQFIDERVTWAEYYRKELGDIECLHLPQEPAEGSHGWQSFVTMIDPEKSPISRNDLMEKLQVDGISTRPGTHAIHMLNYYRERYGFNDTDFPGALACNDNSMAIPLHNRMVAEDYQYIVQKLKIYLD